MNHIFISYSRKDKAFVVQLHAALTAAGRNVWVDWEDIPPTAEWMADIQNAIEAADAFLFIISPDSLRSDVCSKELTHAITHQKRLIPLLHRDPESGLVPAELAKLNWIYFRPEEDAGEALKILLSALDTDLEYVRNHTRFLVLAREWQTQNRSASLTLRGEDLRQAESWLAHGAAREPRPLPLQVEFISASRQAERTRQRRTLSAVLLALAITSGLAVLAFTQFRLATAKELQRATAQQEAVNNAGTAVANEALAIQRENARATQQAIAEENRRQALSSNLAAQARLLYADQIDLALLLSNLAWQISPGVDALSSLHGALEYRPDLEQVLNAGPDGATLMAIKRDGSHLVTAASNGVVREWQVDDGSLSGTSAEIPGITLLSLTIGFQDQVWLTYTSQNRLIAWDVNESKMLGAAVQFSLDENKDGKIDLPHLAALSPNGKTLAFAINEKIYLRDVTSGNGIGKPASLHVYPPSVMAFSADSKTLATAGNEWKIFLWDSSSGTNMGVWNTEHSRNITSLAFSNDGRYLASGSEDGTVNVFNRATGQLLHRTPLYSVVTGQESPPPALGHPAAVRSLAFSLDGEHLVSGAEDGGLLIWNTSNLNPVTAPRTSYTGAIASLTFLLNGNSFAAAGTGGKITLWQPDNNWRLASPTKDTSDLVALISKNSLITPEEFDRWNINGFANEVQVAALSSDNHYLAAGGEGQTIYLWDLVADQVTRLPLVSPPAQTKGIAFSPDNTILAVAVSYDDPGPYLNDLQHSLITLWQIPTTQVIATIALRNSSNNGLAFSQTDQSLVVNQSSGFYIWNLDPDRWQNLACHIVQRNLTQQEWQRYVIGESYRKVCADLP